MSKLYKSRHLPYKVFVKMLYRGQSLDKSVFKSVEGVDIGQLAKSLRTTKSRVIEAFEWLGALGMIQYDIKDKTIDIKIML